MGLCDCHVHLFDPDAPGPPVEGDVAALAAMHDRLAIRRAVIVQANAYATDNSVAAAGIATLGQDRARGVAIIAPETGVAKLRALHEAGFRGVRCHMLDGGFLKWRDLDAVAARARSMGWHMQLQLDCHDLPDRMAQILRWDMPVVIDHIGKFTQPATISDPGFAAILRLLDTGRAWVKLSAPYEVSARGAPAYEDVGVIASALADHAPERMLWASNWPHVQTLPRPDDAALLALLREWVPDAKDRQRILCDNPAELYGFEG